MRLAVIRHGATAWNLERRVQGHVDTPLDASGRQQLAELVLPVACKRLRWYCSPLRRATETADLLGIENYQVEPRLIEMNWGDWEGEVLKPLRRRLGEAMRSNEARGVDFRPPSGESPREVQARLRDWLGEIAAANEDVGAVAHQGIIRCLYALALNWDLCGEAPVEFAWNALHLFEFDATGCLLASYDSMPLEQA